MYVSEVRDLVDALLYRFDSIESARAVWLQYETVATIQATNPIDDFSHEAFSSALNSTRTQQTVIFDAFEALLAAWARLSLLFYPIGSSGDLGEWRKKRGELLRVAMSVPAGSLLSNRSFRDSWMHFDERLDQAYLDGWLGNRQQFVKTAGVPTAIKHSVRVVDIQALKFHYRSKNGETESVSLVQMRDCLSQVQGGLMEAGSKIMQLFTDT